MIFCSIAQSVNKNPYTLNAENGVRTVTACSSYLSIISRQCYHHAIQTTEQATWKIRNFVFVTLPRWRCLNVPARICTKMAKDSLDWKAFFSNKIFNCSQIIFARTKYLIIIFNFSVPESNHMKRFQSPRCTFLSYEGPVCVFVHLRKPMPLVLKNINCQNPRKNPLHADAHNTIQTFAFEAPM